MNRRTDNRARGFTLTELLVVIAIITILATIAIPNLLENIEKGRVAGTLADVKNADTSLRSMLSDAGVSRFQDFLTPEARFVLKHYDDHMVGPHPVTDLTPIRHKELLYRTLFYTLLRIGRDAGLEENLQNDGLDPAQGEYGLRELFTGLGSVDDGNGNTLNDPGDRFYFGPDDPDPTVENAVFDRALINKLRTSYMDIGADAWGNPLNFWMGPLERGSPANPVPLRSFRLAVPATVEYEWDLDARKAAQKEVMGQPPFDDEKGYPAPIDLPVYIWSNGTNEEQDAHISLRTSNDPGYSGGGDDVNNWDSEAGWQSAPRPIQ